MSGTILDRETVQRSYLEFGKALLSSDTNFPEIPPEVLRSIIDIFIEESVAQKAFSFKTMSSDTLRAYVKAETVEVYAPSEGSAPPESKLVFGTPIELVAREVRVLSKISDAASEEAVIDLVAETVRDVGRKMAETIDRNVLTGDGSGSDAYNLFTGLTNSSPPNENRKDLAKSPLNTDHILEAVSTLEEKGYRDRLVLFLHPRAAYHLRKDLASKGLEGVSTDVFKTGRFNELFGLEAIHLTTSIGKRSYSQSDQTKVSDAVVCYPEAAGVGGLRRRLTVEKDRDIERGLTIIAASTKFAWKVAKPDAIYLIRNALAQ
ncbi:MAG: phage major capsid protein [Nitrososphaerota archaeon]|nr:phage major capsid protein [Candidatus Calditenuaceae archaeon]MDW8073952.1 phage major capsid protein [Nitrososphaerota archaeon]